MAQHQADATRQLLPRVDTSSCHHPLFTPRRWSSAPGLLTPLLPPPHPR